VTEFALSKYAGMKIELEKIYGNSSAQDTYSSVQIKSNKLTNNDICFIILKKKEKGILNWNFNIPFGLTVYLNAAYYTYSSLKVKSFLI